MNNKCVSSERANDQQINQVTLSNKDDLLSNIS